MIDKMKKLEYRLWIVGSTYVNIITSNEYTYIKNVLLEGGSAVTIKNKNGDITIYPVHQIHKLTEQYL